jgi:hypothetical protein
MERGIRRGRISMMLTHSSKTLLTPTCGLCAHERESCVVGVSASDLVLVHVCITMYMSRLFQYIDSAAR